MVNNSHKLKDRDWKPLTQKQRKDLEQLTESFIQNEGIKMLPKKWLEDYKKQNGDAMESPTSNKMSMNSEIDSKPGSLSEDLWQVIHRNKPDLTREEAEEMAAAFGA